MRSLRSRTVDSDSIEQENAMETTDNDESNARTKKIKKSKKLKKSARGKKFSTHGGEDNTQNFGNTLDVSGSFCKSKSSKDTVNTSINSVTSENVTFKISKKSKKAQKKAKTETLSYFEEDALKSYGQNFSSSKASESPIVVSFNSNYQEIEDTADAITSSYASEKKSKKSKKSKKHKIKNMSQSQDAMQNNKHNYTIITENENDSSLTTDSQKNLTDNDETTNANEKNKLKKSKKHKKSSKKMIQILLSPDEDELKEENLPITNENISPTFTLKENKLIDDTAHTSFTNINSTKSDKNNSKKAKKQNKDSEILNCVLISPAEHVLQHYSSNTKETERSCTSSNNKQNLRKRFFSDNKLQIKTGLLNKVEQNNLSTENNITYSLTADDRKNEQVPEKSKSKFFKSPLKNTKNFVTETEFFGKNNISLLDKDDIRPSFLTSVTSTNKKQIPEAVVNLFATQKNSSIEGKISNPNKSSDLSENKSNSVKNSSTPKGEQGNNTYELVTSEISDIAKNKSPNNFSNFLKIGKSGPISILDDISGVNMDEIINISDETMNSKRITFDISNQSNDTLPVYDEKKSNATHCQTISGHSGEWVVEKLTAQNEENLRCFPSKNILTEDNKTPNVLDGVLSTPDTKSKRKKWIKFAIDSDEAKSLLEEIGTPVCKRSLPKTPIPKRSFSVQKTPISKVSFNIQKTPKPLKESGGVKRTVMPDFAKIHQRAFEKMESLKDYSERKKKRAQMLLSSNKTISAKKSLQNQENLNVPTPAKSARELFKFATPKEKITTLNSGKKKIPKASKLPVRQLAAPKVMFRELHNDNNIEKQPIFTRANLIAAANKIKPQNTAAVRQANRNILKGVRVNRRFELLMQMRNK